VVYERAFLYGELGYASMLSLVLLVSTAAIVGVAAYVARTWLRTAV
jgi:ABC-type sugar transport system permease subunit